MRIFKILLLPFLFATLSYAQGGPPTTYSARTDNCETGSESGCVTGRTQGEAGAAMAYQNRLPGDLSVMPNFGGFAGETLNSTQCPAGAWNGTACTSAVNAMWTDPDFGATGVRVCDGNTFPVAPPQQGLVLFDDRQWHRHQVEYHLHVVVAYQSRGWFDLVVCIRPLRHINEWNCES
jgi:hypothetical protein